MSNYSIEQVQTLTRLAVVINDRFEQSEFLAADTRSKGNETVKERILLGHALIEAKPIVGHGNWRPWLTKHCPKISFDTAERSMRLAKAAHVRLLDTAAGMRQAYIVCGILEQPESEPAPGEQTEPGPDMTIDRIAKRVDWFRTRLTKESVVAWSREQRERMAAALRPMVDLYSQLIPDAC